MRTLGQMAYDQLENVNRVAPPEPPAGFFGREQSDRASVRMSGGVQGDRSALRMSGGALGGDRSALRMSGGVQPQ